MPEYLRSLPFENWIALLGLIIACVALGWNILNEIRKTPRLRVTVMIANMIQQGNPQSGKDDYFSITISNVGERPVRVCTLGGLCYKWWWQPFKKNHFMIIPQALPAYLKDGEVHNELFLYRKENFKKLLDDNLQRIVVYDSAGKGHPVSRRNMIRFKNHIRRHLKKNTKN